MFADDTALSASHSNLKELEHNINLNLSAINNWLKSNKLTLNIAKTNYIIFNNKNKNTVNIQLKINDSVIAHVDKCKYLGLILDNKLSFKYHLSNMSQILSFKVGILCKLRKEKVPSKILQLLYNSLILPYLNYCHVIWCYAPKKYINVIHKIQKFCKSLIGDKNNIMSLNNLKELNTLKFYISFLRNSRLNEINNEINLQGRHRFNLKLRHVKTSARLNTIYESGRMTFNNFINRHNINPFNITNSKIKKLISSLNLQ